MSEPQLQARPKGQPRSADLVAGAQFVAIAWVVLNQFRNHLGLEVGARTGLVAKGYLGAALFFVLNGFLVSGCYQDLRRRSRFQYGAFLWRRLSFTYPLHVIILAAMAALLIVGGLTGETAHHASFSWRDLPANLLFVQAWGLLPTDSWNFPSWLVSADWFAFLVFPLTAWLSAKVPRSAALSVAAAIALFGVMFVLSAGAGVLFTDMTARIGALQTVPAVLLGVALWRLDRELALSRTASSILVLPALAWIAVAASLRLSDLAIWPAFAPLVLGLAQLGPWARWAPLRYLGRLSIAMMLVYLPVDILYFRVVHYAFGNLDPAAAWLVWAGVFPAIFLTALIAHHGLQQPLWTWLQARSPFALGRKRISSI